MQKLKQNSEIGLKASLDNSADIATMNFIETSSRQNLIAKSSASKLPLSESELRMHAATCKTQKTSDSKSMIEDEIHLPQLTNQHIASIKLPVQTV